MAHHAQGSASSTFGAKSVHGCVILRIACQHRWMQAMQAMQAA